VVSAASNALNREKQLEEDMLYIREISVDLGGRRIIKKKRGRGRVDMLMKRICHITVVVDEIVRTEEKGKKNPSKRAGR
jgi:large subunit ribosomal protein L22